MYGLKLQYLKYVLYVPLFLLLFAFLYLLIALVGSLIPLNRSMDNNEHADIIIYLSSNGIHTDFVLPISNQEFSWYSKLNIREISSGLENPKWIVFGWGDRKFYLETPEWKDLTIGTALSAVFLPTPSAMHVTVLEDIYRDEFCVEVRVTKEKYLKLIDYIDRSFKKTEDGKYVRIPGVSYYGCDAFYEANGKFHLFYTCNTWANQGLKQCGLPSALWTPFDRGVLCHYRR